MSGAASPPVVVCHHCRSRPMILLAHPSMDALAQKIVTSCETSSDPHGSHPIMKADSSSSDVQRVMDAYKCPITLVRSVKYAADGVKWEKFADGFPNLFLEKVKNLAGRDVLFLASFDTPQVIFEQLSVIYEIPRYLARSFTLILPYFPTGTMERVDKEGQIATAKPGPSFNAVSNDDSLAHLLSGIPLTARGPAQVVVFDIHALQERFYFGENVIPRLESAIPLLVREIQKLPASPKVAIVFPDDGAKKRFHTMFSSSMQIVVCDKVRVGDKKIVKLREGDIKGYHAIIVDDLVQTGGTLIECAKVLKANGASQISAYVTHPVFPNGSWKRFCDSVDPKFSNFWITDSIPHAHEIAEHEPFKLLSLATVIADALLSYDLKQD